MSKEMPSYAHQGHKIYPLPHFITRGWPVNEDPPTATKPVGDQQASGEVTDPSPEKSE